MVGVQVRQHHDVHSLKRLPCDRRPNADQRPNPVADHWIGEQLHAVELEQRGRVAEPGDRGASARHAAGRSISSARCHLQPTTAQDGATAPSKRDDVDSQPAPAADPPPTASPRPGPPELGRRPGRTRPSAGRFSSAHRLRAPRTAGLVPAGIQMLAAQSVGARRRWRCRGFCKRLPVGALPLR